MNQLLRRRLQRASLSDSGVNTPNRRKHRTSKVVVGLAGALLVGAPAILVGAATPPPAHINNTVGLKTVGPIDESNGFPLWYKDTSGQRLELCLDQSSNCIMGDLPTPGQPMVFPNNFPDEAFWSVGDADLATNGTGGKALLVTAVEAAFAGAGVVADGQQITFGRIRIRAAGVIDGATYKVTHPYGVDTFVAETGAVKGINNTEDIGDLVGGSDFTGTLASRPAPFLKWDPTIAPAAPTGYLGDPTVAHEVTGSPYNTNVFRIEGPLGSFPGSPNQCTNPALGDSASTSDLSDCIETNLFTVMGKLATRAGVQVTKAVYANEASGHTIDLFAKSEAGQHLIISGTGIAQTEMHPMAPATTTAESSPTAPADRSRRHQRQRQSADRRPCRSVAVRRQGAHHRCDLRQRHFKARRRRPVGRPRRRLTLCGLPSSHGDLQRDVEDFTVTNIPVPPADATVTSKKGGTDSDDVVITGTDFTAVQVVASIATDITNVSVNQAVTLDGTGLDGTITSYPWTKTAGPAVTSQPTHRRSASPQPSPANTASS